MEDFLEQLLHFQHFRQFINSKIDKLKRMNVERDLFDDEVLDYEEGSSRFVLSYLFMVLLLIQQFVGLTKCVGVLLL